MPCLFAVLGLQPLPALCSCSRAMRELPVHDMLHCLSNLLSLDPQQLHYLSVQAINQSVTSRCLTLMIRLSIQHPRPIFHLEAAHFSKVTAQAIKASPHHTKDNRENGPPCTPQYIWMVMTIPMCGTYGRVSGLQKMESSCSRASHLFRSAMVSSSSSCSAQMPSWPPPAL